MHEPCPPQGLFVRQHLFYKNTKFQLPFLLGVSKLKISPKRCDQRMSSAVGVIRVTTPFRVFEFLNHPCPELIAINVSLTSQGITVRIDDRATVTLLKEMTLSFVDLIAFKRKPPTKVVHESGESRAKTHIKDEMGMTIHPEEITEFDGVVFFEIASCNVLKQQKMSLCTKTEITVIDLNPDVDEDIIGKVIEAI